MRDLKIILSLFFAYHSRPHCGGFPYRDVSAPRTLAQYYNFHSPNATAYNCDCPPDVTGDMCETCAGTLRYTKEPGICADCDCSDLSTDPQCDRDTGQCSCMPSPEPSLAGRQCVSFSMICVNEWLIMQSDSN